MIKTIIAAFFILLIQISASGEVLSCDKHDGDKTTPLEESEEK
jgi:hypothetical protein